MIVAGIDIGNSTTELLIADVTPRSLTLLAARRAWTSGQKGGEESVLGAARLLLNAETTVGRRCELSLMAPLRPVLTLSASMPPPPPGPDVLRRLDGATAGAPAPATPAGRGFAVGAHVALGELSGRAGRSDDLVVSVPPGADFAEAAARIAAAQQAGLHVVAVVVAGDDAVLIANRIPQDIPIVDEADVEGLRPGELVAVEVAEPGARVQVLADPVALVAAFRLSPAQASSLAELALSLADARCAALVLDHGEAPAHESDASGWLEYEHGGAWAGAVEDDGGDDHGVRRLPLSPRLAEDARLIRPGSVRGLHIPADSSLHDALGAVQGSVRDLFAVDLPALRDRFLPRHGTVQLGETPLAVLLSQAAAGPSPDAILEAATGRPVRVTGSEAEAAALGALTTPGAAADAAVCDLGGGTIDLVYAGERLTAAGAGELLTMTVAASLGLPRKSAEYAKRFSSFRAERPHVVHYEDGGRGFVDDKIGADALGRLCYLRRRTVTPFADGLAPEEWRALRLAIKQSVIGANVSRCLRWLGGRPAGVLLCGGAAQDAESVRIVSESLRGTAITVGKANINGTLGPRYGVALGLLLDFQRNDGCS